MLALVLSAGLCFVLAWSLTRPIKQLQAATKLMAVGDMSARVDSASERSDEIGQLARDFNHMSQQVDELMVSQKRLLADISHELRSPLARLQLAIGIAQQSMVPSDKSGAQDGLMRIEKEAQQIENMIAQVLNLARFESQAQNIAFHSSSINSLLEDIIQDARFEAEAMNKVLSVTLGDDANIMLNPEVLRSAIENIIRNGVEYANKELGISSHRLGDEMQITVRDDGTGLAEKDIDKIFTPFYRVCKARDRDSGGVGLGLAIAQRAVLVHKGSIEVQNSKPTGLQLTITLPIART